MVCVFQVTVELRKLLLAGRDSHILYGMRRLVFRTRITNLQIVADHPCNLYIINCPWAPLQFRGSGLFPLKDAVIFPRVNRHLLYSFLLYWFLCLLSADRGGVQQCLMTHCVFETFWSICLWGSLMLNRFHWSSYFWESTLFVILRERITFFFFF